MTISIITPTFNRADCLGRCLDSVTSQLASLAGGVEIEHVVADDGSTDSTREVLESYAAAHAHVHPVYLPVNVGVNGARNAAIAAARGEWCLLLDSDDRLAPGALSTVVDVIGANPGFRLFSFAVDDRAREMASLGPSRVFTFDDFLSERITGDFAHVIDREVMLKYPFDESLRIFESIFFLRFHREVGKTLFTNKILLEIERRRPDSVSLTYIRRDDAVIARKLKGALLMLEYFGSDYEARGWHDKTADLHFEAADNALLLGDYATAAAHIGLARKSKKAAVMKLFYRLHAHRLYKFLLQAYLKTKYRRPERGVS